MKTTKKKSSGRFSWQDILMIAMGVLILVGLVAAVSAVAYVKDILTPNVPAPTQGAVLEEQVVPKEDVPETTMPEAETEKATEAPVDYGKTGKIVNILLVGQDSRAGEQHKLSDTMILCTLNKETKKLTLTSFQRDTYVQLPSPYKGYICGMQRMNVAYNLGFHWGGDLGAMEYLDLLIYNNFGVEVDANVEIDFETFQKVITIFGGINIEIDQDEANYLNATTGRDQYSAGWHVLDGGAALAYARMRHSNAGDNDFKRTDRQRKLINEIMQRCKSLSIAEMNQMADEILPMILTDLSASEITTYLLELLPYVVDLEVESRQCPADGTWSGIMVDIAGVPSSVLQINLAENRKQLMEIAECD